MQESESMSSTTMRSQHAGLEDFTPKANTHSTHQSTIQNEDADGKTTISTTSMAHLEQTHSTQSDTNIQIHTDKLAQIPDLPDPPPMVKVEAFASISPLSIFWMDALIIVLFSMFIAAFGLLYMNLVMAFPEWWYKVDDNHEFAHEPHTMQFLNGRWWWIFVGGLTGLVVSTLRVLMDITEPVPSFIEEITKQHQDPVLGMKVMVCACLSLMGGAGLGPEAGLGAFGGVIGHLTSAFIRRYTSWEDADKRRRLFTLCGMTAAFGSFLPAPIVSVALVIEIGRPCADWGITYMRMFACFSLAGCSAFVLYSNVIGYTPLGQSGLDVLTLYPNMPSNDLYDDAWYQIFVGVIFGLIGSCMALLFIIICAAVKVGVAALKEFLSRRLGFKPAYILVAFVGGLFYGTCGYLMPLTIGDGIEQLHIVISDGDKIGSTDLAVASIVKMFTYAVCAETGFVGGLFLPIVAIGVYMARVIVNTTGVDFTLAICCGLLMIPSALVPIPITMVIFATTTFALGAQASSPVLACAVVAYTMMMGVGIPQLMARKGHENRIASMRANR